MCITYIIKVYKMHVDHAHKLLYLCPFQGLVGGT